MNWLSEYKYVCEHCEARLTDRHDLSGGAGHECLSCGGGAHVGHRCLDCLSTYMADVTRGGE